MHTHADNEEVESYDHNAVHQIQSMKLTQTAMMRISTLTKSFPKMDIGKLGSFHNSWIAWTLTHNPLILNSTIAAIKIRHIINPSELDP